jgi:hypothetical protein
MQQLHDLLSGWWAAKLQDSVGGLDDPKFAICVISGVQDCGRVSLGLGQERGMSDQQASKKLKREKEPSRKELKFVSI